MRRGPLWFGVLGVLLVGVLVGGIALGFLSDEPQRKNERPIEKGPPPGRWAQWRGPLGTGVAPGADPPVEWSETSNIRWRVELPGEGHGTPAIWDDRLFVTAAVPYGDRVAPSAGQRKGEHNNKSKVRRQKFVVLAISRKDGKVLWQRTVKDELPHEGGHFSGSYASPSPVTDGEHVIASFGSRGIYCLDMDGKPVWEADLGDMQTKHGHGEGSTPALHGDTLILNWDHEGRSFVVALDKRTGQQRWKMDRDEGSSWSTPLVVEHAGKAQVVISATNRVRSYDLESGKVVWECGGLSRNVVASPVAANGMLYTGSSYGFQAMLAIRLAGATGDITATDQVVWKRQSHTPYVPSPVLYDGRLYYLSHYQPRLSCIDIRTGEPVYAAKRLPGIHNVYASLVAAAGRIYIVDLKGRAIVIEHGAKKVEMLALNELDDSFASSPAIAGRELYLRGSKTLYCIASD